MYTCNVQVKTEKVNITIFEKYCQFY